MSSEARDEETGKLVKTINEKMTELSEHMERVQIADYVQLLNRPRRLIILNLVTGISRGVGIAIGFTVFTATIVYILKALGALNIPIIGDYISDIVDYVQRELQMRYY